MDRSLDAIINERQREISRGQQRDRRQNNYPRDGVRKNQRDETRNLDRDWVHDRYEDDYDSRRPARNARTDRRDKFPAESREYAFVRRDLTISTDLPSSAPQGGTKIRVDNLHYDLTQDDLEELFNRVGRVASLELLYDRQDRSRGIAYVTYAHAADARSAIREFDGANAHGQPIRLTMAPATQTKPARNPFDTAVRPAKSLFERIERRSASPDNGIRHSDVSKPAPSHIDRYVPGQENNRRRSPLPPRRDNGGRGGNGGGGGGGRRPGARREQSSRRDDGGRPTNQGRPRKTAEELDAEMADYFNKGETDEGNAAAAPSNAAGAAISAAPAAGNAAANQDDDIDMIE